MHICRKLGFQPFHNSNGVLGTTFVGTRFNIYTVVLRASVHKDSGSLELLRILLTMSINVRFLLSATPFWSGEPRHCVLSNYPMLLKKLRKGTRCLSILGVSTIIFSTSIRSHNLYLLFTLFFYFSLKNFKGTQCFILAMEQVDIHVS